MSEITYRPIPVAQIKNDYLRRFLMVVTFVPIMVIGWIAVIMMTLVYFIKSIILQPVRLYKGMIIHWSSPLIEKPHPKTGL